MAVAKLAYLTYQTFCLSLLRPFAVSFCLCTTGTTNSRDILLPNIVLLVLHFFRFYLILPIFTPPNLNFFLLLYFLKFNIHILFWKFEACSFPIFDWSKTPVVLYFEKKSYMINQESRALSDFLKTWYMINHNAQKYTMILKYTMICNIWLIIYHLII